jgi:hypothetical protein
MKPKCELHKTWPAIPKGCKVHPRPDKRKRNKPQSSSKAPASSQTRSESIIERPTTNKPAARRITPVAMTTSPSIQSTFGASSSMSSNSEIPSRNSSKMRIEAMVERRIKSHNRRPTFKKGLKTIRRMSKIFGRA